MSILQRHPAYLTFCLALLSAGLAGAWPADDNLLKNPSFEQAKPGSTLPNGWNGPVPVYSIDRDVHRTGSAALKYVNPDAGRYCLASQKVDLRPGRKYRFSVWVKTAEIAGPESGATICLEWQDKHGKWLGGAYPSGVKGTADWTRVEGVTRVPEDAASFGLQCYVRKNMTGTAWFDDVELVVRVVPTRRCAPMLLSPVYRGWIDPHDGPGDVSGYGRGWNLKDHEVSLEALGRSRSAAQLADQATENVLEQADGRPFWRPIRDRLDLECGRSAQGIAVPERYDVAVRLERTRMATVPSDGRITRLDRSAGDFGRPRDATIDEHRRLLGRRQALLPYRDVLERHQRARHQALFAQSKFNCLMPYGSPKQEQMDLAERHGLKVIYSIKDWYAGFAVLSPVRSTARKSRRGGDGPRAGPSGSATTRRLLAWYLNDELPQTFLPQLEAHRRWVVEEDRGPSHLGRAVPVSRGSGAYLNTFDVIGTDPYPIGRKPASMAAEWTAETFRQVEGARPLWQVPQLHNWANYRKTEEEKKGCHTPTFEEIRSMAWQCIAEGATGLVFYSWFDVKRNPDVTFDQQWAGLKRIAAEIDRTAPILLSTETAPEGGDSIQPTGGRRRTGMATHLGAKPRRQALSLRGQRR